MRRNIFACIILLGISLDSNATLAQNANDIINIFGGLARAAAVQAARSQWQALASSEINCIEQQLRASGSSVNLAIQQGIGPSDSRLLAMRSQCRAATSPQLADSIYSVDGFVLHSRVRSDGQGYHEYRCGPSKVIAGYVWCQKDKKEQTSRGSFNSYYSLVHSPDGAIFYINRELRPAWFSGNEANDDIARLSKKYGAPTQTIQLPTRDDGLNGVITVWGDVRLTPLSAASTSEIAAGRNPAEALFIDHINNSKRSAELGLPIYGFAGGVGFVWAASWNKDGVGTLQFLAIDPSILGQQKPSAIPEQQKPTAPAVSANPGPDVAESTAPRVPQPLASPYAIYGYEINPKVASGPKSAVVGTIASSDQICAIFNHPLFGRSANDNLSIDPNFLASKWLRERVRSVNLQEGNWIVDRSTLLAIETSFSDCLSKLPAKKYDLIARQFLPYLNGPTPCYIQTYRTEQKLEDGKIVESRIPTDQPTRCASFDRDGGRLFNEPLRNTVFLAMVTLAEAHASLTAILDQAEKIASVAEETKLRADEEARQKKIRAEDVARAAKEQLAKDMVVKGDAFLKENPTDWAFTEEKDRMTGQVVAKVTSEQSNENGAVAAVTGQCVSRNKVEFRALIVDEKGKPTVGVSDRVDRNVRLRYRMNDKLAESALPWVEYNNQFVIFDAMAGEGSTQEAASDPIGLTMVLLGLMPYYHAYQDVWAVMAEFKTTHGDLIVSIPTRDSAIQRLYRSCFS
jgi:hypothetical protein